MIDDEPLILKSYGRNLQRRFGHDVVTAIGGAAGLADLENDSEFDLIICDLSMPGISGIDVHRTLCDHHPELANRFIFLTGGNASEMAENYLASNGIPVLTKPVSEVDFEKALTEASRSGCPR
jgi:CheY-like chemotaxis protein